MSNRKYNIVEKAINKGMLTTLEDIIIYQEQDGTYKLFKQYSIEKTNTEFKVTCNTVTKNSTFYTLQNAVAWCIYDKQSKIYQANRIVELDHKLGSIEVELAIHTKQFIKSKTTEEKLIFIAKVENDQVKKTLIIDELKSYMTDSKRWQTRRFDQKPNNDIKKINSTY